jgi:hypothetical protein
MSAWSRSSFWRREALPVNWNLYRTGRHLDHELLDLPLRAMGGSRQDQVAVLDCEMRRQQCDAAEVNTSVREARQQDRMSEGSTGCDDPQVRLRLGKVKDASAVREHRGAGSVGIQPSLIHLGDVCNEVGFGTA